VRCGSVIVRASDFQTNSSRVRVTTASRNDHGKVVHTHVPLLTHLVNIIDIINSRNFSINITFISCCSYTVQFTTKRVNYFCLVLFGCQLVQCIQTFSLDDIDDQ